MPTLTKVSRPNKQTFWGVAHWHSYRMNYVHKMSKSAIHSEHRSAKLIPPVLPRLKLLNALKAITPALFPVRLFTDKRMYLNEPFQGLNLNCRSISGIEPEMLVTSVYSNPQNHVE